MLSFQHKLIQEYLAAIYIAENVKADETSTFIEQEFPTERKISDHKEVLLFTCGILADTNSDANPVVNHVGKILAEHTQNQINTGKEPLLIDIARRLPPLLPLLEKEGGTTTINPYMCEYPACGRPLAEVLANTQLAIIDGIDANDPLQLNPSSAQIILITDNLGQLYSLACALHTISDTVIAMSLLDVSDQLNMKPMCFTQLKFLSIEFSIGCETLYEIDLCRLPEKLTFCRLIMISRPRSAITALRTCTQLLHLDLRYCYLKQELSTLMANPPPVLKVLKLASCNLCTENMPNIIQAIREDKLKSLQELDIQQNAFGETAVKSLLELVTTRCHSLKLFLNSTGEEDRWPDDLSEEFVTEWKRRLAGTRIKVQWSTEL